MPTLTDIKEQASCAILPIPQLWTSACCWMFVIPCSVSGNLRLVRPNLDLPPWFIQLTASHIFCTCTRALTLWQEAQVLLYFSDRVEPESVLPLIFSISSQSDLGWLWNSLFGCKRFRILLPKEWIPFWFCRTHGAECGNPGISRSGWNAGLIIQWRKVKMNRVTVICKSEHRKMEFTSNIIWR